MAEYLGMNPPGLRVCRVSNPPLRERKRPLEPHLDPIGFCPVLCRPFFDVRHTLVPTAYCRSHALHGTRLGSSRSHSDT